MTAAHLHLLLNHLPVIGVPFAGALLVVAIVRRERAIIRTALAFCVVVALVAIPVFLTGEPAEEVIEQAPGVTEAVIEPHEDLAKLALLATGVLGVVGVVGLVRSRGGRPVTPGIAYLALAAVVLSVGLLTPTAYLGGQIRHTEIRSDALTPPPEGEDDER